MLPEDDKIKKHVVVYYDDPELLNRDEDTRIVYGFVVSEDLKHNIDQYKK